MEIVCAMLTQVFLMILKMVEIVFKTAQMGTL